MCPADLTGPEVEEWGDAQRVHFAWEDGAWRWVAFLADESRAEAASSGSPVSSDADPRPLRVPTVDVARVQGSLDKDVVRRFVRAHIIDVRSCYNDGLRNDPDLRGRVVIQFTIDPQGKVPAAVVAESALPDASVAECIAEATKRWSFPEPAGGGDVVVTYPFVLSPD